MIDVDATALARTAILAVGLLTSPSSASLQQAALPSRFDTYLTSNVRLTASERSLLLAGDPVTRLLDSDPGKEVAVFGAIWINASRGTDVQQVQDIERSMIGRPSLATYLPDLKFITVNRSRSDGLSGYVGGIVRGRVRNEVENGTLAALIATKSTLEASAR